MKYAMYLFLILPVGVMANFQNNARSQAQMDSAKADMINTEGKPIGYAALTGTPHGVLVRLQLSEFPPGVHAFHIHEVGKCEPPFKSAGGHFNPLDRKHGVFDPDGKHAGDLMNLHITDSGFLTVEALAREVSLTEGDKRLLDDDGAALVIHAGRDDYRTDPAGAAGSRIACGVIQR